MKKNKSKNTDFLDTVELPVDRIRQAAKERIQYDGFYDRTSDSVRKKVAQTAKRQSNSKGKSASKKMPRPAYPPEAQKFIADSEAANLGSKNIVTALLIGFLLILGALVTFIIVVNLKRNDSGTSGPQNFNAPMVMTSPQTTIPAIEATEATTTQTTTEAETTEPTTEITEATTEAVTTTEEPELTAPPLTTEAVTEEPEIIVTNPPIPTEPETQEETTTSPEAETIPSAGEDAVDLDPDTPGIQAPW